MTTQRRPTPKPRNAGKRSNGRGSIYWDATKSRYVGAITTGVDPDTGQQLRRRVTGRTQAEVATKLDSLRVVAGLSSDLPTSPTVSAWLTYWLTEVLPLRNVKSQTIANYETLCRMQIDPAVGRLLLVDLEARDVRGMVNRMTRAGLSGSTQSLAVKTLRMALNVAMHDGLLTRNVALAVPLPRKASTRKTGLTVDQAQALLDHVDADPDAHLYGALVRVMLGLGLRRGEALGLRWSDIDLDAGKLTVAGQLTDDGTGRTYYDAAKWGSERTVWLPAPVLGALTRWRATQAEQRLAAGASWGRADTFAPDVVFTTPTGTKLDPDYVTRRVTALAKAAGIGHWTPHALRHSAATILLAQGVPLALITELLGHSGIGMTADVYAHVQEPAMRNVADVMGRVLR